MVVLYLSGEPKYTESLGTESFNKLHHIKYKADSEEKFGVDAVFFGYFWEGKRHENEGEEVEEAVEPC